MNGQGSLFPRNPAQQARAEAIDRAALGSEDWLSFWYGSIVNRAKILGVFTTDDIWETIPKPAEPRALGAVLTMMRKDGLISPRGWRESTDPTCHARPKRVWEWIG